VFERFTERARQVVVLAQYEAHGLKHNYIGTEHILLGLLREQEGLAARVLESFDVTLEEVRAQIARIVGHGETVETGQIPFTPRAKKVLELSLREALALGHNYIGTEHILLGIARENEGVASKILLDFEADAYKIRDEVIRMLSGPARRREAVGAEPTYTEAFPWGRESDPGPESAAYSPKSPPTAPEVGEELSRLRRELEQAIENQTFAEAAQRRDRERRLVAAIKHLEQVWFDDGARDELDEWMDLPRTGGMPVRVYDSDYRRYFFVLGAAVFGTACGVGLLVGWLIWG